MNSPNLNISDLDLADPKKVTLQLDEDDHDYEAEARENGWAPETEWQGAPPKHGFLSAKDFVKRGEEVMPIIKAKNRRLEGEITALQSQLTELQGTAQRFNQFAQNAIEREKRDKERVREQLEQRRAQAITDGDGQAAVSAEKQLSQLDSLPSQVPGMPPPPPQYTEEQLAPVKKFIAANPWYETDPDMRDWADARAVRLRSQGHPGGEEMFARVSADAREAWAHKFKKPGAARTGVETGGHRQADSFGKRTFDDLPDDAKRAYDDFRRTNPRLTKTEYLNLYEWD